MSELTPAMTTTPKSLLFVKFQTRTREWNAESPKDWKELSGSQFSSITESIMQLCEQYSTTFEVLHNGPFEAHRTAMFCIELAPEAEILFRGELDSIVDGPVRSLLKVWDAYPINILVVKQEGVMTVEAPEEDDEEETMTAICGRCFKEIGSFDGGDSWFHTEQTMGHPAVPE